MRCPSDCTEHGHHYWHLHVTIGPIPQREQPHEGDGGIIDVFTAVADLVAPMTPNGCDVDLSSWYGPLDTADDPIDTATKLAILQTGANIDSQLIEQLVDAADALFENDKFTPTAEAIETIYGLVQWHRANENPDSD